jgi:hypothetical protein
MKIQIIKDIIDCVDGYNPIFVEEDTINLDVPDNSISSILMINTIELISYKSIDPFLSKIRQLLRLNGNIVITGVDINCLSVDCVNRAIDCAVMNEVIYNRKAIYDCKELSDKLSSLGIKTDKLLFKGATYELHATRKN